MLITVYDVPEENRSDAERAGGEVVGISNGLIDVQFKNHRIRVNREGSLFIRPTDGGAVFIALCSEYSKIIIY